MTVDISFIFSHFEPQEFFKIVGMSDLFKNNWAFSTLSDSEPLTLMQNIKKSNELVPSNVAYYRMNERMDVKTDQGVR